MAIKYLVLSGGSYNGLKMFGALKHLHENGCYDINNIEKIYATSVGSIIAVLLALNIPMDNIQDYIIRKPWNKVFNFTADMLFGMITEKGIVDKRFLNEILEILFKTADIDINSTMLEFYNKTSIELHFYSTHVSSFKLKDLSHITYPELNIMDAIYMSCSIPFIIQPMYFNDSYMIDGGVLCNFPLSFCCDDVKNKNEILAINLINGGENNTKIDKETNLLKYGHFLFDKLAIYSNKQKYGNVTIKHILNIICENSNVTYGYKLLDESEAREKIINQGIEFGKLFLEKL